MSSSILRGIDKKNTIRACRISEVLLTAYLAINCVSAWEFTSHYKWALVTTKRVIPADYVNGLFKDEPRRIWVMEEHVMREVPVPQRCQQITIKTNDV